MNHDLQQLFAQTAKKAVQTLEKNVYEVTLNGIHYRRTVPSKQFYVHQWNWDSCTHAMGLIHVDPQRAYDELISLVAGQWENGLIAQITFNPTETKYYPGTQFWGTDQFAKGEIKTTGITQPPLLGIAVHYVYKNSPDKDAAQKFLDTLLPAVIKYHDFLKTYRDPEDSGLLTVIHPWESGTDNSPRWDSSYEHIDLNDIPDIVKEDVNRNRTDTQKGNVSHRPTQEDYYRFMYLVHLFNNWQWDFKTIVKNSPFAVKDILFSALWGRANECLAELLEEQGQQDKAATYSEWARQTKQAIEKTWNEKANQYCDIDVAQGRHEPIIEATNAMFIPLWAGAVTDGQLEPLLDRLSNPRQFWPSYPVPTTALNSNKFELAKYWRGPTWPITNLFIIEGLNRYSTNEQAKKLFQELLQSTLSMIAENGFYEYYDPTKGAPRPGREDEGITLGFGEFSWSAAVFLYLYNRFNFLLS